MSGLGQSGASADPRLPAPLPFAKLRDRLGIPADAPPSPPEPLTGPLVDGCDVYHAGEDACSGSFRIVEQTGPVWLAVCDSCRAEVGVPARRLDPQVRRAALLERAGLPDRFRGVRFEETAENRPALQVIRAWLADAHPDPAKRVASLLPAPALWSDTGVGKSHLLSAICTRLVNDLDVSVLYRSARGLLRELKRFEEAGEVEAAWRQATRVDVLALDDLGAPRSTEWSLDQLADLLDERYGAMRPVLVATNYPPAGWDVFDARSRSRLRGMTVPVQLGGPDRRQLAMQDNGRSIQAGSGVR